MRNAARCTCDRSEMDCPEHGVRASLRRQNLYYRWWDAPDGRRAGVRFSEWMARRERVRA